MLTPPGSEPGETARPSLGPKMKTVTKKLKQSLCITQRGGVAASPGFCFHLYKKTPKKQPFFFWPRTPFLTAGVRRAAAVLVGRGLLGWWQQGPRSPHCLGPGTGSASWAPKPAACLPVGVCGLGETHLLLIRRGSLVAVRIQRTVWPLGGLGTRPSSQVSCPHPPNTIPGSPSAWRMAEKLLHQ